MTTLIIIQIRQRRLRGQRSFQDINYDYYHCYYNGNDNIIIDIIIIIINTIIFVIISIVIIIISITVSMIIVII